MVHGSLTCAYYSCGPLLLVVLLYTGQPLARTYLGINMACGIGLDILQA